jgi:hypothetical protein
VLDPTAMSTDRPDDPHGERPSPSGENQGEGDRRSARRYNDHLREFVVYGDAERAARDAAAAVEGPEAASLRAAEERGKAPARMSRRQRLEAFLRRARHAARDLYAELRERLIARRSARADS